MAATKEELCAMVRKGSDPVLWTPCVPLTKDDNLGFLLTMRAVCRAAGGIGLAAPQIGVLKRAIFIHPYPKQHRGYWMLNPVVEWVSPETASMDEGCLSFPGVLRHVTRPTSVRVRWYDAAWDEHNSVSTALAAVVVQHEMDHLDGVCQVGLAYQPKVVQAASK